MPVEVTPSSIRFRHMSQHRWRAHVLFLDGAGNEVRRYVFWPRNVQGLAPSATRRSGQQKGYVFSALAGLVKSAANLLWVRN
jgi:hypothetical protein